MSKHWDPRAVPGGRARRRPASYGAPKSRIGFRDVGQTVLLGVGLGIGWLYVTGTELPVPGLGTRVEDVAAVDVIDGDTFHYGAEKIRIADIDTPEMDGRCEYEVRLAMQATDRMEALLDQGPFVMRPVLGRDEDRYGRKLRIVTRGGQSLGQVLVAEDLAREWTGRREGWC
jgi:endonuclease YncB( thermonuclease family)